MTFSLLSWWDRRSVDEEMWPELQYLQNFWYPLPNDQTGRNSCYILLMCTEKKTIWRPLFWLTHFRTKLFQSFACLSFSPVTWRQITCQALYINCTLFIFREFVYSVIPSMKPHAIKYTMLIARQSTLSSIHPIPSLMENQFSYNDNTPYEMVLQSAEKYKFRSTAAVIELMGSTIDGCLLPRRLLLWTGLPGFLFKASEPKYLKGQSFKRFERNE